MIIFLQCMAKKLKSHSSTELGVVIEKKIHYISYHQACVFIMKTTNFLYFTHSGLWLTLRVSKRIYLVLQMFKQCSCKIERCRIIQLEIVANRNGRIKCQFRQTHSIGKTIENESNLTLIMLFAVVYVLLCIISEQIITTTLEIVREAEPAMHEDEN